MFAVILLLTALIISYIVVQIGAVAFEMTGLERRKAIFQALSCFSTAGFTTREAELIVEHPRRRKIAMTLMILGNVGLVTVISGFVVSMTQGGSWIHLRNLAIIVLALLLLTLLLRRPRFTTLLRAAIRKELRAAGHPEGLSDVEVLSQTAGYGVARLHVPQGSPLAGRSLRESGLRQQDIIVLAIDRQGVAIPLPAADRSIQSEDILVCFGLLNRIGRYATAREPGQKEPPAE